MHKLVVVLFSLLNTISFAQAPQTLGQTADQIFRGGGGPGLSQRNYRNQDSLTLVTNTTKVAALSALVGGTVQVQAATNTTTRSTINSTLSAVSIAFVTSSSAVSGFSTFAFPGHNFTNANAVWAFCYLTTTAGVKDTAFVAFDKRVGEYKFKLKRKYMLSEGVRIGFGYCNASYQTFATGAGLGWVSNASDPLILLTGGRIQYYDPAGTGLSIYGTVSQAGSNAWTATQYTLYNDVPILEALASGGGSSTATSTTIVQAPTQPFNFVLPPKLYWIAGNPLWMYQDATIYNYNVFQRRQMDWAPIVAKKISDGTVVTPYNQYPDRAVITPTEPIALTLSLRDYSQMDSLTSASPKTTLSKSYTLTTITKPTSKTINVLVIADSFYDIAWGQGIYKYISDMATADGNTIVFKGTRTSYGYLGEARASWSESTFLRYVPTAQRVPVNGDPTSASMSSPFMFSTDDTPANATFQFNTYLSTNNIGAVDIVLIALGKNGGTGNVTNTTMIPSIQAALPNAKIIISQVTPVSINRANLDVALGQKVADNQNLGYNTLFGGRESSKIYLCPAAISFPRLYGHNGSNVDQVQFNNNSIPQVYHDSDHHPNATGAKAIGWSAYNYILYASMQ